MSGSQIAYSPDGKILASGDSNGQVSLRDIKTGSVLQVLKGSNQPATTLAFSTDCTFIVSGAKDGELKVWNLKIKRLQYAFTMNYEIVAAAFTSDSAILSCADTNGNVRQWNTKTGEMLKAFPQFLNDNSKAEKFSVNFSRQGDLLAYSDKSNFLQIWNLQTGNLYKTLPIKGIASSIFSPNKKILATVRMSEEQDLVTGGNFHILEVWNVQTAILLGRSEGREYITALAFDSIGENLITGGVGGEMQVWAIPFR